MMYALYDAQGNRCGVWSSLWLAKRAVPPSEQHLWKILPYEPSEEELAAIARATQAG